MPIPWGRNHHEVKIVSCRKGLVVVRSLGIELRSLLSRLHRELARMLGLLRHDIANSNHLRVLGQEPTE
jgi:hypothetical protein